MIENPGVSEVIARYHGLPFFAKTVDTQVLQRKQDGTSVSEIKIVKGEFPEYGEVFNGWTGRETRIRRIRYKDSWIIENQMKTRKG